MLLGFGMDGNVFRGDRPATPERLADPIEYVVDLVGIDHAGLSSDYALSHSAITEELSSMQPCFPSGYGYDRLDSLPPSRFFEVAAALTDGG
ncbi:MAG: hypothetical protein AAFX58_02560 [Pseudomonadota bacterium]